MDSVDFYGSFHTHPVNKLIHFICIPLIVLSTLNFLSKLSLQITLPLNKNYLGSKKILKPTVTIDATVIISTYTLYYYIVYNWKIGLVMQGYIYFLCLIGIMWRELDEHWLKHSIIMFASAWIMQFLGHAIEGNRPALMTSLSQTVFQAPLLTLEYVYPSLLQ